jgi:hypothetical protein
MAKHRLARNRRKSIGILAFVFAGALVAAAPATADQTLTEHLKANGQNSVVSGACSFTVTSVDYNAGLVSGQMGGQATPTSVVGYLQIAHNRIICQLTQAGGGPVLAQVVGDGNSPNVGTGIVNVVVPQYAIYTLCGQAQATLHSGTQSTTGVFCATG